MRCLLVGGLTESGQVPWQGDWSWLQIRHCSMGINLYVGMCMGLPQHACTGPQKHMCIHVACAGTDPLSIATSQLPQTHLATIPAGFLLWLEPFPESLHHVPLRPQISFQSPSDYSLQTLHTRSLNTHVSFMHKCNDVQLSSHHTFCVPLQQPTPLQVVFHSPSLAHLPAKCHLWAAFPGLCSRTADSNSLWVENIHHHF